MTLTPEALADLRVVSFNGAPVTAFSMSSTAALLSAGYVRQTIKATPGVRGLRPHLKITDAGRAELKREHDREQSK